MCYGKKLSVTNRLDLLYPEVASQWHPTKNGDLKPTDFTYGSDRKVWWKCNKCNEHEWEVQIWKRTNKGYGCKMCSGEVVWKLF